MGEMRELNLNKDMKLRYKRRLFNEETLRNIYSVVEQIDTYREHMKLEDFIDSNEVEELYKELRALGLDLFDIGR